MREDGGDAELQDEIERGFEPGEASGVDVATLEEVSAPANGPIVGEQARPAEEEAHRIFMAEPAGHVGPERRDAIGVDIEHTRALQAHQPLVGAGGEVVDPGGGGVDGHRAAGLHRVHEDLGAGRVREGGHGLDRHAQTTLELHRAHRHEARPAGELGLQAGHPLLFGGEEVGDRHPGDFEAVRLGGEQPGGHVGGELPGEEDHPITAPPGETEGDVADAAAGVGHQGDVLGPTAHEPRELLPEAASLRHPAAEGGGAVTGVVVEHAGDRAPHGERGWGDGGVVPVDVVFEVGEEAEITEPRLRAALCRHRLQRSTQKCSCYASPN